MADAPRVSVVIPAFEREGTIRAAMESVLRQTVGDLELIVVDDRSSDGTAAVAEAVDDPRVRVIRLPANGGPSVARNAGLEAARGEWVAFQDSDDEWLPTKLERQFAAVERLGPGTIGAYCGMLVIGTPEGDPQADGRPDHLGYEPHRRGPPLAAPLEGDLRDSLLRSGSLISTQTFMGRRDALLAAGRFDESLWMLEDWDYFLRVAEQGAIAFEPEPLVIQRFSSNSLTRSHRRRVEGLAAITERYERRQAERMPEVLLMRFCYIAGGYRRLGEMDEARRWLARAGRIDPLSRRVWKGRALVAMAALRGGRG